jgi:hypothetical protein
MKSVFQRIALMTSAAAGLASASVSTALAQFGGPIPPLPGTASQVGSVRDAVVAVLTYVLNFLALVAVIMVVIAGIRLIVSQGDDDAKEKAKKTIIFALVGLIVILFARVIVGLVTQELASYVS